MKILIVGTGLPSKRFPLNGIFEFDQAKALSKIGHEIIFAAVDCRSIRRWRKFGFDCKDIDGIKTYVLNIPMGPLPDWALFRTRAICFAALYGVIEKRGGKPDIVHGHFGLGAGYASAMLCNKYRLPLVITEHDSDINARKIKRDQVVRLNNAYRIANKVVAVGNGVARRIKEYTNVDAIIIPNIVDTSSFNFQSRRDHDDFNFVSVGNLIYGKGMDLLINSFHAAFKYEPHVKLFIYGDGVERHSLKKLVISFGLADRIRFMGAYPRINIADKFRECDCFVLASRAETFGVVYIEALASGLPVIATKCGGPEDFVNELNGILVTVDDEKALIDAMLYMYAHSQSYDARQISKETINIFSPETIARRLTQVYKEALLMCHRCTI